MRFVPLMLSVLVLPPARSKEQSFQSDFAFEGTSVSLPFSFTHSSAVLSCSAEPEKSNLATGPNYGVHFYPQEAKRPLAPLDVPILDGTDDVGLVGTRSWTSSAKSRQSS